MKLAWKLLAAPLLTALVVFSAGQINVLLLNRVADNNLATMNTQLEDYRTLSNAQEQLAQIHTGLYRTVALIGSLEEPKIKAIRGELAQQLAGVQRVAASIGDTHADDVELRQSAAQFAPLIAKYLKQADEAIDLSSVDPNTGIAALQSADASFNALTQTMRAMITRVESASAESVASSNQQALRSKWLLAALSLLMASTAVYLSWLMQHKLTQELQRATEIAGEVAAGNLAVDASSERVDEVGDLVRALGRMTVQLGGSMQAVLAASASIRTASAEIASGNMDLSERTEQTASSLQQAASSMDELTSTVRQSASSALEANRLAATAADVAARGGRVVAQVVSTMEDINISSRKIGDIIGVIDSIAFQTNILALNAAVEAARAGEQGRGFAVVAGEVRSLAQRSAQAAREIKGLIGASVDKVEGGTKLVADAGQTMGEIVGSVERVSAIIGEISTAAAEQSRGLDLVNGSVVKLDQMTQQNAALVEESAAAAESMKDQAIKLADIVDTFKLP